MREGFDSNGFGSIKLNQDKMLTGFLFNFFKFQNHFDPFINFQLRHCCIHKLKQGLLVLQLKIPKT